VESGLKKRWPENLSVKNLFIVGSLNVTDIEYLSTVQGELKLTLNSVAAEQMYQLLDHMGQLVKTLAIEDTHRSRFDGLDIVNIHSDVIVERILAACPNLEHFECRHNQAMAQDDRYNLPPAAFKNYKE
jgi:hypothetical protein